MMRTRLAVILLGSALGVAVVFAAQATQEDHKYATPNYNGYTWEHFDQDTLWGCSSYCGTYVGQTSSWTDNNVYAIGSQNDGSEVCNGSVQQDWDTGWYYVYNGHQAWIQGSGGYNTSLFDCNLLGLDHDITGNFRGTFWQPFSPSFNDSFWGGAIETLY